MVKIDDYWHHPANKINWNVSYWGKPTKRDGRRVYFEFTLLMGPDFETWHPSAKERLLDHLSDSHASATYNGNIDYDMSGNTWHENKVFGDGSFDIPYELLDEFTTRDELNEVAEDAISNVINYNLARFERDAIDSYGVKIRLLR